MSMAKSASGSRREKVALDWGAGRLMAKNRGAGAMASISRPSIFRDEGSSRRYFSGSAAPMKHGAAGAGKNFVKFFTTFFSAA